MKDFISENLKRILGIKSFKKGGEVNWIEEATKNKGGLHRSLNVPLNKDIPQKKLDKALKSNNTKIRKQAELAKTLEKFNK